MAISKSRIGVTYSHAGGLRISSLLPILLRNQFIERDALLHHLVYGFAEVGGNRMSMFEKWTFSISPVLYGSTVHAYFFRQSVISNAALLLQFHQIFRKRQKIHPLSIDNTRL